DQRLALGLSFEPGARDEPREVAIALDVLAQQRDARGAVLVARFANAQVDADDRLHAARDRRAVELNHREQVVLVGDADGGHARRRHRVDEFVDAHHAVDERVLSVQPKMYEARCHTLPTILPERSSADAPAKGRAASTPRDARPWCSRSDAPIRTRDIA